MAASVRSTVWMKRFPIDPQQRNATCPEMTGIFGFEQASRLAQGAADLEDAEDEALRAKHGEGRATHVARDGPPHRHDIEVLPHLHISGQLGTQLCLHMQNVHLCPVTQPLALMMLQGSMQGMYVSQHDTA